MAGRCLLLYTKPPVAGRVKTRLIGDLSAEEAAALHEALLLDLLERLDGGAFALELRWALEDAEDVGSDHPTLTKNEVEQAFSRLEGGADVVLGPAQDGGYFLIACRAHCVDPHLFRDIAWSGPRVLEQTLSRCRDRGLSTETLAMGRDVDDAGDLSWLRDELEAGRLPPSPRVRRLFAAWQAADTEGSA
jgi:glycosyltransferase A (GT-A) superfamily protein (DUF2064 family)